jgi:predicted nucleic acid-binding protein
LPQILVDTSVWISALRAGAGTRIERLVAFDDVVTCLPVIQEVLQGFADERAFRIAREAMLALPVVDSPMPVERIEDAVALFRLARRQGLTVRSSVDCLIAASALHHDLAVLHRDRDYDVLASVSGLRATNVAG